ncbi:HET domain-containing protein [Fusarium falciforme]|uniref:HET domain-containing protein n=1 Tax=Fusarium falciforme TaxID=195108 RepID=UPI00230088C5|nr:HET domain-containing protein [Fusarium falciforme]WAO94874.1 HET domain-containing protein [Fusarium falciforme]
MGDMQERCGCRKPDITIFEMCRSCGNPVNFEDLRQQAINTYDRDGRPIEDPNLPRRHLLIGNPRNNLRVLHLDDDASPILSGTFERASITHLPYYEAVSYCWGGDDGDYTKSEFIIIDGRLFPITKNCAAVLHQIRRPREIRVIWIDSLCINQNDINERSVQVSQMGKIFSGAQKVHIYLGNNVDDKTLSDVFAVLGSMGSLYEFDTSLRTATRVQALKTLFSQTYFSRMWIIQEVLLAKAAELHWGTARIPWQTLSEDHLRVMKKYGIARFVPEWMRIQATTKNFRKSETLAELLFSAMGSTASNNRDKVYGIYGLLLDAEEEGLIVDYSLSVVQVFTNMATHLIKKHNALRAVLRHANHDAPLIDGEQLPSWVPDFRSRSVLLGAFMPDKGFGDLQIQSSITSEKLVSCGGTDELCLRGHKLIIFPDAATGFTRHFQVVRGEAARLDLRWEIRAKFPIAFDPVDHVAFWMPGGLALQLKRHPTREGTYTFLGNDVVKSAGPVPTMVQDNCLIPFADAVHGWKLQDLRFLWKFCTHFEEILQHESAQTGLRLTSINFPNISIGWENAESFIKASRAPIPYSLMVLLSWNRPSMSHVEQMLSFTKFWESQDTWETLHRLDKALHYPEGYDIGTTTELCEAWLQCYKTAKDLINRFLVATNEDATVRPEILEHIEAWESTTEKLSEALNWTEGFWPFETRPRVRVWYRDKPSRAQVWNWCEDSEDKDGEGEAGCSKPEVSSRFEEPTVDWVVKNSVGESGKFLSFGIRNGLKRSSRSLIFSR